MYEERERNESKGKVGENQAVATVQITLAVRDRRRGYKAKEAAARTTRPVRFA